MAKKDHKTQKSDKFTIDQLNEIKEGKDAGLDISIYAKPEYYAIQMRNMTGFRWRKSEKDSKAI